MAGFFGADVEQLRQLATALTQRADEVLAVRARIDARIAALSWRGPDATRFVSDWNDRLSNDLLRAANGLSAAADAAIANARQQEEISGGAGGGGGAVPTPGGSGRGPMPVPDSTLPHPIENPPPGVPGVRGVPEMSELPTLDPNLIARDMEYRWGRDYLLLDDGTKVHPGQDYFHQPDGSVRWSPEYASVNPDGSVGPKVGLDPGQLRTIKITETRTLEAPMRTDVYSEE